MANSIEYELLSRDEGQCQAMTEKDERCSEPGAIAVKFWMESRPSIYCKQCWDRVAKMCPGEPTIDELRKERGYFRPQE